MATWKKVIVSGSDAVLNKLSVGTNQVISTDPTQTIVSGSFSGSFYGSGANLTGLTATAIFPTDAIANPIVDGDKFFTSGSQGEGNSYVTASQVSDYVFSKITAGPVRVSAGGTSTVENSSITNQMLQNSTISGVALGSNLNNLTLGNGFTAASTYNGGAAVTATIGAGTLITVNTTNVAVKAGTLTDGNILRYTSANGLENSFISQTATQIAIDAAAATGLLVNAGGIDVTGNSTFGADLQVDGNLVVNGSSSFNHVINLAVQDQFILLNSGSSPVSHDGGLIVLYNSTSGSAFYYETAGTSTAGGRWGVQYDVEVNGIASIDVDEYVVTAKLNNSTIPTTEAPTWGGASLGYGNMWINNGDIYIYT